MTRGLDVADRTWLARAIALGASARGITGSNPPVGCVLVADGRIVGEGATRPVGGPHAEAVALADAGATARGATAYVSLEPCAHQGRTPPCADALLDAGVVRVVFLHPDPNPVAGGGAERLRDAGTRVEGPLPAGSLLRDAVARQLEGFLTLVTSHRPHVTLKIAQTVAGDLQAAEGQRWITGPAARRAVHRWRASVDAVLVGSGTVLADDPRLTVRDDRDRPRPEQPRPVVLDARLRIPVEAAVVARGAIVITSRDADVARVAALRAAGATVERVRSAGGTVDPRAAGAPLEPVRSGAGGVDLRAALRGLAGHGIASVLAEPGRTLAQALLDADLVDRLVVHVGAPRPSEVPTGSGGRDAPARGGRVVWPAVEPAPDTRWRLERRGGAGSDAIIQFTRERGGIDAARARPAADEEAG